MKIQILISILSVLVGLQSSHAQNSKYMIDGVDTTPLVEAFNRQVTTLQKPIKVYHWFNADPNSKWAEQYSAHDPRGFEFVKFATGKFWNQFGDQSRDAYGAGLYTATDPVISRRYGGPNWVLLQIELTAHTRVLDIGTSEGPILQEQTKRVLNKLGCEGFYSQGLESIFSNILESKPERCKRNLKALLNSAVHFEAISYEFDTAYLEGCDRDAGKKAFLIIDNSRIRRHGVQIFNSKTRDEDRLRTSLQSVFYKTLSDGVTSLKALRWSGFAGQYIEQILQRTEPNFELIDMDPKVVICPVDAWPSMVDCKTMSVPLPSIPYPKQISVKEVPFQVANITGELLWADLDGKPTDPKIDEWIANNLYKCGK